jgi:hypothetical protein
MSIFQAIGITSIKKTVHVNPACFEHTAENLARMAKGKSPIGIDGLHVNLHHIGRKADSPLATLTDTFHKQNTGIIHNLDPPNGQEVDRKKFNSEKRKVWKGIAWLIGNSEH